VVTSFGPKYPVFEQKRLLLASWGGSPNDSSPTSHLHEQFSCHCIAASLKFSLCWIQRWKTCLERCIFLITAFIPSFHQTYLSAVCTGPRGDDFELLRCSLNLHKRSFVINCLNLLNLVLPIYVLPVVICLHIRLLCAK